MCCSFLNTNQTRSDHGHLVQLQDYPGLRLYRIQVIPIIQIFLFIFKLSPEKNATLNGIFIFKVSLSVFVTLVLLTFRYWIEQDIFKFLILNYIDPFSSRREKISSLTRVWVATKNTENHCSKNVGFCAIHNIFKRNICLQNFPMETWFNLNLSFSSKALFYLAILWIKKSLLYNYLHKI